jgi:pentapeptide MXKDX repeat protein
MKKTTITIITTAALAFAMPLYAADDAVMESDSQEKAGITQQGMNSGSNEGEGLAQEGMKSDSQEGEGLAQEGMKSDSLEGEGLAQQSGQEITAEELEGMEVVSQEGEEIGEIKMITIDEESGEVKFVTFSKGGILGMGGEEIAAPLSAFEFGDDQARLTVHESKLKNVPKQTAEATDSDYQRDLETHYGVAPAWEKGDEGDTTQNLNMDQENPTQAGKVDTQSYDSGQLDAEPEETE